MSLRAFLTLLSLLTLAGPALAVPGATDRVPAASLLVPFFETGTNSTTHPHDTLLVVNNRGAGSVLIHYHVWTIDGVATALNGNVTLAGNGSWSAAMRDLIAAASSTVKTQLTQAPYYRGFVTIDLVTAATANPPTQGPFPFGNNNRLEGYIYYGRLSKGAASGLAMVPLESLPSTVDDSEISGFYSPGNPTLKRDNREDLGPFARLCAARLASFQTCGGIDYTIGRIDLRVLQASQVTGSRAIVFAWDPQKTGGPSVHCDEDVCDTEYTLRRYLESGALAATSKIRLDHVVNVINVNGTAPGWVSLSGVPSPSANTNFYAFSFNSSVSTTSTWDTLFEAYIEP
jgi:hypothetical protein